MIRIGVFSRATRSSLLTRHVYCGKMPPKSSYAYMSGLLAMLLLLAASVSVGAEERSVILIDEEHMQIGREDEAPSYVVSPSAVIVVDFTAHKFNLWPDPSEPQPDTVGIAVSATRQYYFSIPAGSRRPRTECIHGKAVAWFRGLERAGFR